MLNLVQNTTRTSRTTGVGSVHRNVSAAAARGITFQFIKLVRNHQNQNRAARLKTAIDKEGEQIGR